MPQRARGSGREESQSDAGDDRGQLPLSRRAGAGSKVRVSTGDFIHVCAPLLAGLGQTLRLGAEAAGSGGSPRVPGVPGSHVLPPVPQNLRGCEQEVLLAGRAVVGLLQDGRLLEGLGGGLLSP